MYLDTTIPSYYHERRSGVVTRAWHELTMQFWHTAGHGNDLYISDEVLRKLGDEKYPVEKREKCLDLVKHVNCLRIVPEVSDLAMLYVKEGLMPSKDYGDAYHLAYATWYRVQYLLTWNCKHLANAHKYDHITVLNTRRRLLSPLIVTPAQLLGINP